MDVEYLDRECTRLKEALARAEGERDMRHFVCEAHVPTAPADEQECPCCVAVAERMQRERMELAAGILSDPDKRHWKEEWSKQFDRALAAERDRHALQAQVEALRKVLESYPGIEDDSALHAWEQRRCSATAPLPMRDALDVIRGHFWAWQQDQLTTAGFLSHVTTVLRALAASAPAGRPDPKVEALRRYHAHMGDCPECDAIVCDTADDLWFAASASAGGETRVVHEHLPWCTLRTAHCNCKSDPGGR